MNKQLFAAFAAAAILTSAGCTTHQSRSTSMTERAPASTADLDCKITFSMTLWSKTFAYADGNGVVTCENGQTMPVKISVKGNDVNIGKWNVDNGHGSFTDVHAVNDVLGTYAAAAGIGRAAMAKSGQAVVVTNGTVSLALAGTGEGKDGVGVGWFTIKRR